LESIGDAQFNLRGELGRRLDAVTENWILPAPFANPGMLEMFRNRNRLPLQDQVPWAGEFAGKYLTHAVQILRLTDDDRLREHVRWFVRELVSLQSNDGYLGPWPDGWELTGRAPNPPLGENQEFRATWDPWGHYHVMLGLVLWYDVSAERAALDCAARIADLFCQKFLDGDDRLVDTGSTEMNLAPVHTLCLLHREIGNEKYLELARQIANEFEEPGAGDYIRQPLEGIPFYKTPKPRWESLHPIQGIVELYLITGEEHFRKAFEQNWWSMLEFDRHNNGGFTSGEQATGDPYHEGAIETCCTVAWMAMSVDMLRLTGDSIVADELELSMFNSGLGMVSPSGRWVTYNTPMDGHREASAHTIVFQSRAGTPELNCCSVNGPRTLGLLCEWGLMRRPEELVLNYYGPGELSAPLSNGNRVTIIQETDYPRQPSVSLLVRLERPERFTLALRVPYWSARTAITVNDETVGPVSPGKYLRLDREWGDSAQVKIEFDFSLHYWNRPLRESEDQPHSSIYRGPILLAFDHRYNAFDAEEMKPLDAKALELHPTAAETWLEPWLLLEGQDVDGRAVRLTDFASAGAAGNPYQSWLPVSFPDAPTAEFTAKNPLRSLRP
jgi:DUF1680 family protein